MNKKIITTIAMLPIGKLMKKHHRHVNLSVKAPPSSGPTTEATPYVPPINPVKIGLRERGTDVAIRRYAPENTPLEPRPAMARPMIKVVLFGATPLIRDPTSKMAIAMRKTYFME